MTIVICDLTWRDIKANSVIINKTLSYKTVAGGVAVITPKNAFSNREILITDDLIELLNKLKTSYQNLPGFADSNFVFGNIKHLPHETIRRKLKECCSAANVKLIRIHDFRHSHASLLISKHQDIVTISRRLGHSNIEMTLNRYAHLMPNKQKELVNSLNNIKLFCD